jgi:4-carboxymuconolactone decarboxylase
MIDSNGNPLIADAHPDLGRSFNEVRRMKVISATLIALTLVVTAPARAYQGDGDSGAGAKAKTQGQQANIMTIQRRGTLQAQAGPAANFTGTVRVEPLFSANAPSRTYGARVTFEAGARSNWHTHPLGQTLIVTAGVGRVQQWGEEVQEIREGDVVWTPPGVKHWHGASPTTSMTHLAIQETDPKKAVQWMEKVTDAEYGAGVARQSASTTADQPKPSQKAIGNFAPKFAQLTDDVL